jgi:hypothetical protein
LRKEISNDEPSDWPVVARDPLSVGSVLASESSPFIVGAWKPVYDTTACQHPVVDTEFRFTNPTILTLTLEYAFFEDVWMPERSAVRSEIAGA